MQGLCSDCVMPAPRPLQKFLSHNLRTYERGRLHSKGESGLLMELRLLIS